MSQNKPVSFRICCLIEPHMIEKHLSIRTFSDAQKRRVYEKQQHKCPCCQKNGIDTEYAFEEMEGDHIIPWSKGGRTVEDNLQMLCKKCNNDKGNR